MFNTLYSVSNINLTARARRGQRAWLNLNENVIWAWAAGQEYQTVLTKKYLTGFSTGALAPPSKFDNRSDSGPGLPRGARGSLFESLKTTYILAWEKSSRQLLRQISYHLVRSSRGGSSLAIGAVLWDLLPPTSTVPIWGKRFPQNQKSRTTNFECGEARYTDISKNENILNAPTSSAVIAAPTGWPVILRTMIPIVNLFMTRSDRSTVQDVH